MAQLATRPCGAAADGRAAASAVTPPAGVSWKQVRNRRLRYLNMKLDATDYFSDVEMREREPRLYQEYVGKYIPESEKTRPFPEDMTLVQRVYSMCDNMRARDALEMAERREKMAGVGEAAEEEEKEEEEKDDDGDEGEEEEDEEEGEGEEEDEEEDDDEEEVENEGEGEGAEEGRRRDARSSAGEGAEARGPPRRRPQTRAPEERDRVSDVGEIGLEERAELRGEFVRLMRERFLSGLDADFEYALCDLDPDFDDVAQMQRDAEDAYFDSMEEDEEERGRSLPSSLAADEYDY